LGEFEESVGAVITVFSKKGGLSVFGNKLGIVAVSIRKTGKKY
jgi:hypothetical protein